MTVSRVPSLVELAGNALSDEIKEKYIHDTLARKDPATDRLGSIACKTITTLDYTNNSFVSQYNAPQHVKNMPNLKTILYVNCKNLQYFDSSNYAHLKHLELIDFRGSGGDDYNQVSVRSILSLIRGEEKTDEGACIAKKRVKVLLIDHVGRGVLGQARRECLGFDVQKDAIYSGSYSPQDIKDLVWLYFRGNPQAKKLLCLLLDQDNFDINMNFGSENDPDTVLLWAICRGSIDLLDKLLARKDLDVNKTFPGCPTTPYDEFRLRARHEMSSEVAQYFETEFLKRGVKTTAENMQ